MLHGPSPHPQRVGSTAEQATAIYLNDHLAGATFGADLARRLDDWTADTAHDATLTDIAAEIEADRETLIALMERLGVARNPVKQATTWLAEKLSRVKLSGLGSVDEHLELLLALETLVLGVEGKLCMWRTLRAVSEHHPALDPDELDRLIARADKQRKRLEDERRMAGERALLKDAAAT